MVKKILIIIIIGVLLIWAYKSTITDKAGDASDYRHEIDADAHGGVIGTGSMLPMINPSDTLYYRYVKEDEVLFRGRVYVYHKNRTTDIIHRLIGFADDSREMLIFKGDANPWTDEPIRRDQVELELIGICFRGHCDE